MSKREKVLGIALLCVVPVVLLFFGIMWVADELDEKEVRLKSLDDQIHKENMTKMKAMMASDRQREYQAASLSSNDQVAEKYHDWLINLAEEKIGLTGVQVTPNKPAPMKFKNRVEIGKRLTYQLRAEATLPQLVQFLYEFYRPNILHRINSFNFVPKNVGEAGKQVRSGELGITMNIEVISLVAADIDKQIPTEAGPRLNKELDDYSKSIVHRNIFGPANNEPTLTVRDQSKFAGEEISFNIRGRDEDENDQLTFELVEQSIPGAKLGEKKSPDATSVEFSTPALEVGDYKFKVRVTDNGCPAKFTEEEFVLSVTQRQDKKTTTVKTKFKHAGQTRVTAFVQGVSKEPQVWIKVRTTGDLYQLGAGQSFELDEREWIVHAIKMDTKQVVIHCDGKELTFKRGSSLTEPINTVHLVSKDSPTSSDDESNN